MVSVTRNRYNRGARRGTGGGFQSKGGDEMQGDPSGNQAMEALRERLSRLSEASLRINESLDFETVLQGVLDSARSLTGARYGVITLLDDAGRIQDFLYSGLTAEQHRRFMDFPEGIVLGFYPQAWKCAELGSALG